MCRSQWLAEESGKLTVPGHLANIGDRVWVVQQCLGHIPAYNTTQQQLLQYGLEVTAEHCSVTDLTAYAEGVLCLCSDACKLLNSKL